MTKIYKEWYQSLSILNQLFGSFVLNIAFWFFFSLLMDLLLWDRGKSIQYFAFSAVFMAVFWTIIFNWTKIKQMFSGNKV